MLKPPMVIVPFPTFGTKVTTTLLSVSASNSSNSCVMLTIRFFFISFFSLCGNWMKLPANSDLSFPASYSASSFTYTSNFTVSFQANSIPLITSTSS